MEVLKAVPFGDGHEVIPFSTNHAVIYLESGLIRRKLVRFFNGFHLTWQQSLPAGQDIVEKSGSYSPYNILPLDSGDNKNAIMLLPEVWCEADFELSK